MSIAVWQPISPLSTLVLAPMRLTTLLCATLLSTAAVAQIPLPAFGSTFNAQLTRGFWFQAPVSFVITALSVPNEGGRNFQVVEVIDLGAPAATWPATATGTQLFYDNASAAGSLIPCAIPVTAGQYIGILGACTTTVGDANSANSYAATNGQFTSSILGFPVTLTRFGTQSGIAANGGNQPCWEEPAFQLSRIEVYVSTGGGSFALSQPYGNGCYNQPDVSFYELFPAGTFDLGNTNMSLLNISTGYLALPGITTYVPPSPSATVLALTDDSEVVVPLSQAMRVGASGSTSVLHVCSNGFISSGPGNGTGFTPTPATFLNAPQAFWAAAWHDLNPAAAGSGRVKFEEVGGIAYVTWDGVYDYAGTGPQNANTFQVQFDLASGTVHYAYQAMSNLGNGYLTGFSDRGASADPGSMDISAALPNTFVAATFAISALSQTASARPITGTTIQLQTANIPAGSPLGATLFGLNEITNGLDLTSFGMPGCFQYLSLDSSSIFLPVGGSASQAFNIPNNAGLTGVAIKTQSAAFAAGANQLGVITSNGVRLTIGTN